MASQNLTPVGSGLRKGDVEDTQTGLHSREFHGRVVSQASIGGDDFEQAPMAFDESLGHIPLLFCCDLCLAVAWDMYSYFLHLLKGSFI